MIDRYSTTAMRRVWSPDHRWELFLDVELAWLEALEEDGIAPAGDAAAVRSSVKLDPARIDAIEATLRHDVIAFLAHVEEQAGDRSRFLHYGLTSSDALDTVLALQLKEASALVLAALDRLVAALGTLADRHRATPMVGRTHGIHAEITSFGLVAAGWRGAVARSRERVAAAADGVAVGKLSGAVGTHAFGDAGREERVLGRLGLGVEPVATQVVARDRHAAYFAALAVAAAAMEKVATDVRHLQRTEVGEAAEPFGGGQRGSSAMPHKRNPVMAENVCGLARVVRSAAVAALEDVALWHERDISHSSVERMIGPDATATTEFMAGRLAGIVEGLDVRPDRMAENLASGGGLVASEGVLLALVRAGMRRQEAYGVVQRAAMRAAAGRGTFKDNLAEEPEIASRLAAGVLDDCFSTGHHLRWADTILGRSGI
ncbi:MAG: adenylosuccinate lyase [Deltaproteobacteria bacterium]|nr:adenylosuccinate lyase [Deltaproteobacteria bacterium]